ncbi:putative tyrosine-protein phosphatase Oca6p [Monosporozyma unispora]|nr:hypothetical protein C6P44_000530 [Kazachstania unispora]
MSYVTPLHFNTVQPNLYRGSYPREINFSFLRTLQLKNIVSLTPAPLNETVVTFCNENNINMLHIECNKKSKKAKSKDATEKKVKRKKKPVPIDYDVVIKTITFLVDRRNYPVYIHCENGDLITSLVIACLRRFSYWSTVSILNEFLVYNSSINVYERDFIENFKSEIVIEGIKIEDKVPWLSVQFVKKAKKTDKDTGKEGKDSVTMSSIPTLLPKLKFHSL